MLRYEITDTQSIKSMHVHATDMHDCMQLKVKIIISMHNQLICKDFGTEAIGVARGGQSRAFALPSLIFGVPLKSCESK